MYRTDGTASDFRSLGTRNTVRHGGIRLRYSLEPTGGILSESAALKLVLEQIAPTTVPGTYRVLLRVDERPVVFITTVDDRPVPIVSGSDSFSEICGHH